MRTKDLEEAVRILYEYFPYHPLVLRDGTIHPISEADLCHPEWQVKLILYPNPDPLLCPGNLDEAVGYITELKKSRVDIFGLISSGQAISVKDLETDPYVIPD